jgi:hypothetical protein
MDASKSFCQNCGFELEEGSTTCKRCNLVAATNLENFLLSKYKLLAIIGIFGALSVYLSTTAATHGDNAALQYGSYISLAIVILLSLNFGWDITLYSLKILQFQFDGTPHYRAWFKLAFRFAIALLFISFFTGVILSIAFYIVSDITLAQSLMYSITLDFIVLLIITTIYFPYRSLIESSGIYVKMGLLFLLILMLLFAIKSTIAQQNEQWFSIIVTLVFIIISVYLIIRSSFLIYKDLNNGVKSLTFVKFKNKMESLWHRLKK